MKYADIQPDTSLYSSDPERSIALAKVIQAKESGVAVEGRFKGGDSWSDSGLSDSGWRFSDLGNFEYRVKPEPGPVVTHKTEWKLYIPMLGGGAAFDHPGNLVDTYNSRAEALRATEPFVGFVLIVGEHVTYHDGVEVYREVSR